MAKPLSTVTRTDDVACSARNVSQGVGRADEGLEFGYSVGI